MESNSFEPPIGRASCCPRTWLASRRICISVGKLEESIKSLCFLTGAPFASLGDHRTSRMSAAASWQLRGIFVLIFHYPHQLSPTIHSSYLSLHGFIQSSTIAAVTLVGTGIAGLAATFNILYTNHH